MQERAPKIMVQFLRSAELLKFWIVLRSYRRNSIQVSGTAIIMVFANGETI